MLACRLCRVSIEAPTGCDVCEPVRRNLVVVGESEEERPSLSAVGAEVVRLLKDQLEDVREQLKKNKRDEKGGARLNTLANTVAKVIGEVRKLQDDGKKAIESLSFVERAALFIDWYAALPPAYRTSVREQQAEHEVRVSAPVPATTEHLS
jgi:hypothetical protein